MDCRHFQRRINELLDQRSAPDQDPPLRGHARRCPDCAVLLELQREAFAALAQPLAPTPAPPAPPALQSSAARRSGMNVESVEGVGSQRNLSSVRQVMRWTGWAVVAVLLFSLVSWPRALTLLGPGIDWASSDGSAVAVLEPIESDQMAAVRWRRPRLAAFPITSPLSWGLVVHRVELDRYNRWSIPWAPAAGTAWWEPIEEGLAPLSRSLSSAVSVLGSAWPFAHKDVAGSVLDGPRSSRLTGATAHAT